MEEATTLTARMEERAAMAARRRRISMGTPTTEITPTVFTMAVMVEAMEEEVGIKAMRWRRLCGTR